MDDEVDEDDPLIEEVYLTEDDDEEGAGNEPRVIVDEAALRWLSNEAESGRVDPLDALAVHTPRGVAAARRGGALGRARDARLFRSRSRVRAVTARNVQLAADLDLDDLASAASPSTLAASRPNSECCACVRESRVRGIAACV